MTETIHDPRAGYDALREQAMRKDALGRWVAYRHADVVAAATDPDRLSSAVSRFLQVPNGLDGAAHAEARRLLDPFFDPDRMDALEPVIRRTATDAVQPLIGAGAFDAVGHLGARFAVRAQSAWLGWPPLLEEELLAWMEENHAASRSGNLARTAAVAGQFDAIIRRLTDARRAAGDDAADDITTELVRLRDAAGQPLPDEVLVSVLRNWTGGDLGSIALCVGVVSHTLATRPELQDTLRRATDAELAAAVDEMLRIDDPFVSNRRVAARDVTLDRCRIAPGEHLVLNWTAANRDPRVFAQPDGFDPVGNAPANLVYGIGPHACPGRPLATLELRVICRTLLEAGRLVLFTDQPAVREQPPVGGFRHVWVTLEG